MYTSTPASADTQTESDTDNCGYTFYNTNSLSLYAAEVLWRKYRGERTVAIRGYIFDIL